MIEPLSNRTRWAVAVVGGLLIAAALPPAGWWPLAIVGVALWAWALEGAGWTRRLGLGAVVGLAHFLVALAWVPEFTLPGYPLLVLLETAFWALAAVVSAGRWTPIALAGALAFAEAARYNAPFEGLPLAGIDLGQAGGPFLQAARLGGGYAVTLCVGLAAAALLLGLGRRWVALGPAALALLLPLSGWVAPDGREVGQPLRAAIVQGGGPVGFRGVNTDFTEVLERHLDATSTIDPPVDLVLWPENSVTFSGVYDGPSQAKTIGRDPMRFGRVVAEAERLDTVLVAGVVEDASPTTFTNRAVAFSPGGSSDVVDKAIRVPFGEYIPFRSFVDRFADLSAIPSEGVPGDRPGLLRTPEGLFAVSISYEVLFPQRSRESVRLGGQVLLVPTNAASFRRTQVPGQELAAAQLRAVETGRWVLQAAPTGYSAVVDHRGSVRRRSGISEQTVLRSAVPRRAGSTPFLVTGPWPCLLLALALPLTSIGVARLRRRPAPPA